MVILFFGALRLLLRLQKRRGRKIAWNILIACQVFLGFLSKAHLACGLIQGPLALIQSMYLGPACQLQLPIIRHFSWFAFETCLVTGHLPSRTSQPHLRCQKWLRAWLLDLQRLQPLPRYTLAMRFSKGTIFQSGNLIWRASTGFLLCCVTQFAFTYAAHPSRPESFLRPHTVPTLQRQAMVSWMDLQAMPDHLQFRIVTRQRTKGRLVAKILKCLSQVYRLLTVLSSRIRYCWMFRASAQTCTRPL